MAKSEPELYKPAEACKMAEVAPYVLRYWETEFPALAESKEKGGGKLYSARDVKLIARIRELLYDEGFTVAGAKKRLESEISEGRFDDGLSPAPSASEQKRSAKIAAAAAAIEAAEPLFLSEPKRAAPAPRDFPERQRVVKELREIVRLLDRGRRK
ncbi:MAG: MerR family transcriptional regulator [Thermoanaerobaculia bacterium]